MRYPCTDLHSWLRTNESHKNDVQEILMTNSLLRSNGVKGPSALTTLDNFNIVWSFCFDYLHTVLLGVMEDITAKFFHFSREAIQKIDDRLMVVQPSHDVYRLPEKFKDKSIWKASVWKSWFLYYSLPICVDLLPANVLQNYALLVKTMYVLLKVDITYDELIECEINLKAFLCGYEELYGVQSMKFNVHMICHIVESIKFTGPIAINSTFPFEELHWRFKKFS